MNKKLALGVVILVTTAWAQDNVSPQIHAGCGSDQALSGRLRPRGQQKSLARPHRSIHRSIEAE